MPKKIAERRNFWRVLGPLVAIQEGVTTNNKAIHSPMITRRTRDLYVTLRTAEATAAQTRAAGILPTDGCPDPVRALRLEKHECRNLTSLHMGKKGIDHLHPNFQYFINLEELWLNDNKLEQLTGLIAAAPLHLERPAHGASSPTISGSGSRVDRDWGGGSTPRGTAGGRLMSGTSPQSAGTDRLLKGSVSGGTKPTSRKNLAEPPRGCLRLKRLYLSGNVLTTIDGDMRQLKFLEVLLLANNRLANLEQVSKKLSHLHFLKQLDLVGNPLVEELNYRYYIIFHHPSVEVLDRHEVTVEEREQAGRLFASHGLSAARLLQRAAFGSHVVAPDPHAIERVSDVSASAKLVEQQVKAMRLRDAAAKEMERTKVAREFEDMAEARRRFHALWSFNASAAIASGTTPASGGSGPAITTPAVSGGGSATAAKGQSAAVKSVPSSVPAAAAVHGDLVSGLAPGSLPAPGVGSPKLGDTFSGLFTLPSHGIIPPHVAVSRGVIAELTSLVREREETQSDRRRAELDALIAKKRGLIVPTERDFDAPGCADAATFFLPPLKPLTSSQQEEAEERLLHGCFTPGEIENVKRLLESGAGRGVSGAPLRLPAADAVEALKAQLHLDDHGDGGAQLIDRIVENVTEVHALAFGSPPPPRRASSDGTARHASTSSSLRGGASDPSGTVAAPPLFFDSSRAVLLALARCSPFLERRVTWHFSEAKALVGNGGGKPSAAAQSTAQVHLRRGNGVQDALTAAQAFVASLRSRRRSGAGPDATAASGSLRPPPVGSVFRK